MRKKMKRDFNLFDRKILTNSRKLTIFNQKLSVSICASIWLIFLCFAANAQTLAPGAPGKDAQWASAGKQAVGTSANLESKIWFTLQNGALTEVYYPDVTVANVHKLEFVVVNPKTKKVETETGDATHKIKATRPDSLSFQQINTAKSGEWKITKVYTTDPERSTVLIDVLFEQKNKQSSVYELYIYYDPSISNTGMHDTAWAVKNLKDETQNTLIAQDGNISSALMIDHQGEIFLKPFALSDITNGFLGISDGLSQLKEKKSLMTYEKAENGNVVQFAKVKDRERAINPGSPLPFRFKLALSFGKTPDEALKTAKVSLSKGFSVNLEEYEKGWSAYVKTLRKVEPKYQAQFNMAAMVLKAQEDKTVRGANVASLTVPWGGGVNANGDVGGGYHLIWSRDLYHVFTAYMALGDLAAANRALDFLFNIQQKPDGSFPQNSQIDGKGGWGSLQLDEVAYPLIMAYQLKRFDKKTYENHVKRAADFLVKTGPKTPQERWEEKSGYSPSTIAAEIAGLVCAAEIAKKLFENSK
jgi:glucan 1,4-alpha-glucosidase